MIRDLSVRRTRLSAHGYFSTEPKHPTSTSSSPIADERTKSHCGGLGVEREQIENFYEKLKLKVGLE